MLNTSPSVPERLLGDKCRIEHVVGSLVGNSIKFAPSDSEIVIHIDVEKRIGDIVTVLLAVTDKWARNIVDRRPVQ